jgi:hypothetical protein
MEMRGIAGFSRGAYSNDNDDSKEPEGALEIGNQERRVRALSNEATEAVSFKIVDAIVQTRLNSEVVCEFLPSGESLVETFLTETTSTRALVSVGPIQLKQEVKLTLPQGNTYIPKMPEELEKARLLLAKRMEQNPPLQPFRDNFDPSAPEISLLMALYEELESQLFDGRELLLFNERMIDMDNLFRVAYRMTMLTLQKGQRLDFYDKFIKKVIISHLRPYGILRAGMVLDYNPCSPTYQSSLGTEEPEVREQRRREFFTPGSIPNRWREQHNEIALFLACLPEFSQAMSAFTPDIDDSPQEFFAGRLLDSFSANHYFGYENAEN